MHLEMYSLCGIENSHYLILINYMKQVPLNENKSTEFDSLLAESINNNKLKEGTIIKGTIAEI